MTRRAWGVSSFLLMVSCTQVPVDRENGAARTVEGDLTELTQPMAGQRDGERQPMEVDSESGSIAKTRIAPDGVNPVHSRGIDEDPNAGSRTELLQLYMELLERKSSLEEEVLSLRRSNESNTRELEKLRKQRAIEEADVLKMRAEIEVMETSLDQARQRAEEERQKFLGAEEGRLELEIELVNLKTYLLQRGVPLPSSQAPASTKPTGEKG